MTVSLATSIFWLKIKFLFFILQTIHITKNTNLFHFITVYFINPVGSLEIISVSLD